MGEFFDADGPFHDFMERCMEEKQLRGVDQRTMNQELADCAEAWRRVTGRIEPADVDEEELAERLLGVGD